MILSLFLTNYNAEIRMQIFVFYMLYAKKIFAAIECKACINPIVTVYSK